MKLVDQWAAIEAGLPEGWGDVRLTLTTEQPGDLARAAQVLGVLGAGRVGSSLVFRVTQSSGPSGAQTAKSLLARLDAERTWCVIESSDAQPAATPAATVSPAATSAAGWDASLAPLPDDWTDLLCELELTSSDDLDPTALLCAPLNPTRDAARLVFTFRCSGRDGYGASAPMARRCFERLDERGITASTRVLRVLSNTDNVDTQGPVWHVGGKTL